ncbi:MAG: hypothetical protein IJ551_09855 [Prevotella sp.]|nr:hypothetical protein [Prevotella sp.]
MGKRVHVAKRYEVEYGTTEAFNYSHDRFYDLLLQLGGEPNYFGVDDETVCDMFECTKEDYDDAVQNLEVYIRDPTLFEESEDITDAIKSTGMAAEELLKTMKAYLQEADTHDGYLHFASF